MRSSALAAIVVVCAGPLCACSLFTGSSSAATFVGTVSCSNGPPVTQGSVSVQRGRPFENCLVPCQPTSAPVLVEQRLTAAGRFELSVSFDGDAAPADLWILAEADDQSCGSGYNFVTRPLGPVEDGQRLELLLVITPFAT